MSHMSELDIMRKNAEREFEPLLPRLESLVNEVRHALSTYLDGEKIEVSEIVGRVKSFESYCEKVLRKLYFDPIGEMPDLAGVRVVCLFQPDLDVVEKIILSKFDVIQTENKSEDLGDSLMGYQGRHIVLRLGSNFAGPRYDEIRELKCEIQVKTVLQDCWSKISHKLVYKNEASVPKPLIRNLNNVSSLMEIAQSVFDTVKTERDSYANKLEQVSSTGNGILDQLIDHHTLKKYTLFKFPDLPVSDHWQGQIIEDLDHIKYSTINDIEKAVASALPLLEKFSKEDSLLFQNGTDFISKSLGLVDKDFLERHPFGPHTTNILRDLASKIKN